MSKPSPPQPPNYAAAATAQGTANENSAIATNFLNQANQVGPNGSLNYTYGPGITLADGTKVPQATATTTLSPDQQKLYDQNMGLSQGLNDIAQQGLGYVGQAEANPLTLPGQLNMNGPTPYQAPSLSDFNSSRDQVTNAYMARLQPQMDQQSEQLNNQLANQGINLGSEAYKNAHLNLAQNQNDQRDSALLAGDQAQQNLYQNAMEAGQLQYNQGLASSQFGNQAQQQALQENEFLRTEPINILDALRSGNQVQLPQFGNVTAGSQIAPAPIMQGTEAQYNAQMQAYQAQLQQQSAMMGGLATLGSAGIAAAFPPSAIMMSDRRLKKNLKLIGRYADGLGLYLFDYLWNETRIGVMADEIAKLRPWALGPKIRGFATVNMGAL